MAGLYDLPPELLHLIFFELWMLSHRDLAAFRAVCRRFWFMFPATGIDYEKWQALAGPKACRHMGLPEGAARCYVPGSPHRLSNKMFKWACKFNHFRLAKSLLAAGLQFKAERISQVATQAMSIPLLKLLVEYSSQMIATTRKRGALYSFNGAVTLAALAGDVSLILQLFELGAKKKKHDSLTLRPGHTPRISALSAAVLSGNIGAIDVLVEHGFSIANEIGGMFRRAGELGSVYVLEYVIQLHQNQDYDYLAVALPSAIKAGHKNIVEYTLASGIDPDYAIWRMSKNSGYYTTALSLACEAGDLPIVEMLLAAGAQPSWAEGFPNSSDNERAVGSRGVSPLAMAAGGGHSEIVERILEAGAVPDGKALRRAVEKGFVEIVERLLEAGAVPDGRALRRAVEKGFVEIAELLLEAGADPDGTGRRSELEKPDNPSDIELLRETFIPPYSHYPLALALAKDFEGRTVHTLLEAGARPTVRDATVACRFGNFRGLRHLFEKVGRVWRPNLLVCIIDRALSFERELTPEIRHRYSETVRLLLDFGAPPTLANNLPLRLASKLGDLELVRRLLALGADPSAVRSEAILFALDQGRSDIVELLEAAR